MKLERLLNKARRFSKTTLVSALVASSLLISTCGDDKPTKPVEPPKETVKLAENVKILNEATMDNLYSYNPNGQMNFSEATQQISSLKPGDIIISSSIHYTAITGFLRKVSSISQDKKILYTTQATLAETIEEADIKLSKRLTPQDIVSYKISPGLGKPTSSESFDFNVPINNFAIYDADGNLGTTNDQVVLSGNFSFNYDFNFELEVGFFKLKKLVLENTAKESLELKVESEPSYKINAGATLAHYYFAPIPIPSTPLFIVPVIEVNAEIDGEAYAKFTTGISQSAELYAGIIRENGEWSTPVDFETNFDFQAPTIKGIADFKGSIGPEVSLMIYGVAGGYGGIDGFLKLNAGTFNPKWKIYGGLDASLGVKDEILGWVDYDVELINYEKLLAQDTTTQLVPKLVAKPNSGVAPLEVLLDASASTGPITDYEFLFGDGSNNYIERKNNAPDGAFDGKTKHTYNNAGDYVAEVVVGNGQIDHDVAKDTINVTGVDDAQGKIVFTSVRGQDSDIFTINVDGTNEKKLTLSSNRWEGLPSWSPDGAKIVFGAYSYANANQHDIQIMDSEGSQRTQLTTSEMSEDNPVFSPDGRQIAYNAAWVAGHEQLYAMNSDGSNQRRISQDTLCYWDLAWSNAEDKIAFYNCRDGNIYSVNSNGSSLKKLTTTSSYNRHPSWSPNGSKIVFHSFRDGNYEVYMMNADGSNQSNISNSPNTQDEAPCFSPDGKFIVYSSRPKSNSANEKESELWVMKTDGTGKKKITSNTYYDGEPKWSPK